MSGVKIWEENVVIPTYGIGAADKNPTSGLPTTPD